MDERAAGEVGEPATAPAARTGLQGSCQWVVGCPTGAKQSVQLSFLPDTCADGARIVTGARALRILLDHDRPGPPWAAGIRGRRAGPAPAG
ncbi:GMC family oxidoreductase N-terminal domain-containing protein [Streptomyces bottropensis]|uniref:GMC family oxidoreductase N-terminal domain-containing protein n=1 Tax=Streptomyces bottropensis TaxID=42235 RepID=UPI00368E5BC5